MVQPTTIPVLEDEMAGPVLRVRSLSINRVTPSWRFAHERRAEIDEHFAALRRLRPQLWNGRVLLLRSHAIENDVFRAEAFETDFASFIAHRDWGFPDSTVRNFYGMAALRGSDGPFLLGVMAAHTANAGMSYFPSGTPEPDDVVGGRVDLEGSVLRELTEETGLGAGEVDVQPGWTVVFAGPRIALMKAVRARETAEALQARIVAHLRGESQPELDDVRVVGTISDLDAQVPDFVRTYLLDVWRQ